MHTIVDPSDWQAARAALLAEEKTHLRAADALAAKRRQLPWMKVERDYPFRSKQATLSLPDLFDGRRQLIVYHHMLKRDDPAPCNGCGMVADQLPHLAHLHARDTSLVLVSRAPADQIEAFQTRMGWSLPWVESADDFNADFDVTGGFGFNVFVRDDAAIYRTYFTNGRGVETLGTVWTLLDLTPFGRQENWQDAPAGTPQSAPYQWWRLHDEYQ